MQITGGTCYIYGTGTSSGSTGRDTWRLVGRGDKTGQCGDWGN